MITSTFLWLLLALLVATLLAARPLGHYIAAVMDGTPPRIARWLAPLERVLLRTCGGDGAASMDWLQYARALLLFNALGAVLLYALQRLQGLLPLNPQHLPGPSADSALNTAVSFVTNTDWQSYSGESTLGYVVQMAGLAVQNFLSAASGLVVAIVLVRGFQRASTRALGNCWTDLTRATVYVLLPGAVLIAVGLLAQGVIQNFSPYRTAQVLEPTSYQAPVLDADGNPAKDAGGTPITRAALAETQILPMGPVASQEAIKELGTNGGGFFNANSAHPFENPTPWSNLLEMFAIIVIPFALTFTFGRMIGDRRQGWAVLAAMLILLVPLIVSADLAEQRGNPLLQPLGVDQHAATMQAGGNMEGKEVRFGIAASTLFAALTTATSCGAVNMAHDSMTPLGGLVPLFLIQLGELAPGGVGTGLYSILIYAILGVFIAGLMIGRTPEYVGKKIEAIDMKLASVFILTTPFLVLIGTAVGVLSSAGASAVGNPGAHGFTEILYAFSSAANNNGSAFGGLSANSPFYNIATAIIMWCGRFWPIVATLALAGSLAAKKRLVITPGTMPTHGPLFVILLIGSVLLIGVLTYVPALALGPIAEHYLLAAH